jgi:tRNA threonylcarbamoyladenosine biosynthesis protein TsaE
MILENEQQTEDLGKQIARNLRRGDVVTLSGPLGVGKTSLARAIIGELGFAGEVPSPTFAIVQPYEDLDPPIWHVDLYRIEDAAELIELGLDSVGDAVLLVEWPERAGGSEWPNALRLKLDFAEDDARRLTADVPPPWQDRWSRR